MVLKVHPITGFILTKCKLLLVTPDLDFLPVLCCNKCILIKFLLHVYRVRLLHTILAPIFHCIK